MLVIDKAFPASILLSGPPFSLATGPLVPLWSCFWTSFFFGVMDLALVDRAEALSYLRSLDSAVMAVSLMLEEALVARVLVVRAAAWSAESAADKAIVGPALGRVDGRAAFCRLSTCLPISWIPLLFLC